MIVRGVLTAGLVAAVACVLLATGARAASPIPDTSLSPPSAGFLGECSALPDARRARCYIRGLLRAVERSGDPARGLPKIDRKVRATGGFLQAACHAFMHEVGRTWARRHGVTLENLYRFVPRSNDPGCSAGFGMGMTMHLGPQLVSEPRKALETCTRLPTRFREYTCVHGAGHALMRGFHGQLRDAVTACRTLGVTEAPDCAQGAFHDYWISLSGTDGTTRPKNAETSPRSVCGSFSFPRPCWYRYFWEREPNANVYYPTDILRLCSGLAGLQRAGCVGAASLMMSKARDAVRHARTCSGLAGTDAVNCLRGVPVPELAGRAREQVELIRTCRDFSRPTRAACYSWFGRTLAVVTDGRFRANGCPRLRAPVARAWCGAGAARAGAPLRTFS